MELLGKIRRMHVRDKLSVRAISKRTGLSRNTVKKWLIVPKEVAAPKYTRAKTVGKLAAFTAELEQSLKADECHHRGPWYHLLHLFQKLAFAGLLEVEIEV